MMLDARVRKDHLLGAMQRAVHIKAESFHIFLDVLANADGKYEDLVKEMKASIEGRHQYYFNALIFLILFS